MVVGGVGVDRCAHAPWAKLKSLKALRAAAPLQLATKCLRGFRVERTSPRSWTLLYFFVIVFFFFPSSSSSSPTTACARIYRDAAFVHGEEQEGTQLPPAPQPGGRLQQAGHHPGTHLLRLVTANIAGKILFAATTTRRFNTVMNMLECDDECMRSFMSTRHVFAILIEISVASEINLFLLTSPFRKLGGRYDLCSVFGSHCSKYILHITMQTNRTA